MVVIFVACFIACFTGDMIKINIGLISPPLTFIVCLPLLIYKSKQIIFPVK